MQVATVFLSIGSNIGDREFFLDKSVELINSSVGAVVAISSIYETQAWGGTDMSEFLNQVIQLETTLLPELLLPKILEIETELGRTRNQKWEARCIDIDILFYNQEIINTTTLIVPHPYLNQRRFVLVPLFEIAPSCVHPVSGIPIAQVLQELQDNLVVKYFK